MPTIVLSTGTPAFPLSAADVAEFFDQNRLGDPVGWRAIRDQSTEPCAKGCLAPGSSPHTHSETTGWLLLGTLGYIELNLAGEPNAVGMLHPFPTEDDEPPCCAPAAEWDDDAPMRGRDHDGECDNYDGAPDAPTPDFPGYADNH